MSRSVERVVSLRLSARGLYGPVELAFVRAASTLPNQVSRYSLPPRSWINFDAAPNRILAPPDGPGDQLPSGTIELLLAYA